MDGSAIAPLPHKANEQHYEVPAEFFAWRWGRVVNTVPVTGRKTRKTLAQAEDAALRETAERAGLEDGQDVLELGCGWGALSLCVAERFPTARITAVSNSPGSADSSRPRPAPERAGQPERHHRRHE